MNKFYTVLLSFIMFFFYSCNLESEAPFHKSNFFNLSDFDTLISPKDNFYKYVNGNWLKNTTIPNDQGVWGNYALIREKNDTQIKHLLALTSENGDYAEGSGIQKAIQFYNEGMDSSKIEKLDADPVRPILRDIIDIENYFDLQKIITKLHRFGIHPFFKPTLFPDSYRDNQQSLFLELSGMSFHNTDFYALQDSNAISMRADYVEHIQKMFELLGYSSEQADEIANSAYAVEEDIAEQYNVSVRNHTNENYYNVKTLKELTEICQTFIWDQYNKEIGIQTDTVIITNTTYFSSIDAIVLKNGIPKIKNYLLWRVLHHAAPYLSHKFMTEDFRYFGHKRDGLLTQPPRWKTVLKSTNKAVGFAIGELYVKNIFKDEAKLKVEGMVKNILSSAESHIENVEWMADDTKKSALKKLNAITIKVGYPKQFPTYHTLTLGNSYYENVILANQWLFEQKIKDFNSNTQSKDWIIPPQTVNAYYHTLYNELVITAGISQPPFFHYQADDAVNYGAIGAIIAHELTHGFDNIGRQYNAYGQIQNWWTRADIITFNEHTKKLVSQFDQYEPLPGVFINGSLTLNENIADQSGLAIAYHALGQSNGLSVSTEKINGFSQEQRFFISWATLWRSKTRPEVMRQKLMTETHSPGEYRVNGPLSNFTPFYDAFNVHEGDQMWRKIDDRVKIW